VRESPRLNWGVSCDTVELEASRGMGTTAARLKLKGIDGGPHKQRSVWFNSTQREEPYLGLTCTWYGAERPRTRKGACTDAAWLSSARAVRCWVKSRNERNPRCQLPCLAGPPGPTRRKVGMTSSQHGSYVQGYTHATMAGTTRSDGATRSESQQSRSQLGLQAATRLHERGVASNRRSAHCGEYVPGPCTHRPSRHESWRRLKSVR
jgi:hypothetical protein